MKLAHALFIGIGIIVADPESGRGQTSVYRPPNTGMQGPGLVDPSPVYPPQSYGHPYPTTSAVRPTGAPANYGTAPTPTPPSYQTAPSYQATSTYTPSLASRMPTYPTPTPASGGYPPVSLPGYGPGTAGGPSYAAPAPPQYGEMPAGTYHRDDFPPYGASCSPPSYRRCLPTYGVPMFPGHHRHGGDVCDEHGMMCCEEFCGCWHDNLAFISEVGAFKGPLDLDGLNGNFGARTGFHGAVPLWREMGLGLQLGSTLGWYDLKGTQFTGEEMRKQSFTTVGVFQRSAMTGLGYGVVYDWFVDDYYTTMRFSQFRTAVSWQWNAVSEIGFWAAIPDRDDTATIGTPAVSNLFSPVMQGNFYWRRAWSCAGSTTLFAGMAESPSDVSFGGSGQVALNNYLMLTGGVQYILPGSGGSAGRQEEIWAINFGLAIYPGSAMRVTQSRFRAFLPMADNGNFGVSRF